MFQIAIFKTLSRCFRIKNPEYTVVHSPSTLHSVSRHLKQWHVRIFLYYTARVAFIICVNMSWQWPFPIMKSFTASNSLLRMFSYGLFESDAKNSPPRNICLPNLCLVKWKDVFIIGPWSEKLSLFSLTIVGVYYSWCLT